MWRQLTMLYKKCHRNFISQFKFGAKFKYGNRPAEIVERGPLYSENSHCINVQGKFLWWKLVNSNGKINYDIRIV